MATLGRSHSAGGVVLNSRGEVVVVSQGGTSWSLPKGHIEQGEEVLEAAKREIYEESGLRQLHPIKELGSYHRFRRALNGTDDLTHSKQITVFLFTTNEATLTPIDPHNPQALWLSLEEVADKLTHPKDKEFFNQQIPVIKQFLATQLHP